MSASLQSATSVSLILASASHTRRSLLASAGLSFEVVAPELDEAKAKASLRAESATAAQAAGALAELKAGPISQQHPDALVIGADQILECEGDWYDKPLDRAAALKQLRRLSGRTHSLHIGTCLLRDARRLWHHSACVRLTMRSLSDGFLESYLDAAGDRILASVGAYQLEGLGVQLFES